MNRKLKLEELNRPTLDDYLKQDKIGLTIILDNIRSMSNVGTVFRSADCFGIEQIFLCGITPKPPHREIQKTAIGATQSVDWQAAEQTEEAINLLRKEGYKIYAIEQTERTMFLHHLALKAGEKVAIVLGNEVEGVQQSVIDLCDGCIEIEQFGTKHSFNVAVCTGIVLYEIQKQIRTVPTD